VSTHFGWVCFWPPTADTGEIGKGGSTIDTYGIVSVIALAGAALLAYRAFMGSNAGQARAKARAVAATASAPPLRRRRRRRRR
jgi:hypothetical protein